VSESFKTEQPGVYQHLRDISRLNPPRPAGFLQSPPRPNRGSIHERLGASGIPVFFLVGEEDAITPPELIAACHSLIPGSVYQVVGGSGHSAYFEKPDEFNAAVFDFLQRVDRPN
jgi:3-oxoadipate enol-lactonase